SSYVQYTYTYVAIASTTRITLSLREDNYFFGLDNITVYNNAAPSTQVLLNGDFETCTLSSWVYCNPSNAAFSGQVQTTSFSSNGQTYSAYSGSCFYLDGAVGAPDYLSQTFATIVGNTYTISFWLYNPSGGTGVSIDILMST
ncbi:unnamed protein product, partial [Rotaria sp. Silwood2]